MFLSESRFQIAGAVLVVEFLNLARNFGQMWLQLWLWTPWKPWHCSKIYHHEPFLKTLVL